MNTRQIALEDELLASAWERYPAQHLDDYLVRGVEDPRINAQSILTRGLILDILFPGRFTREIDSEIRFGVVLTWILRELESHRDRSRLLEDIANGADSSIPGIVTETYCWLQVAGAPVADYITQALNFQNPDDPAQLLNPVTLDTFMEFWRSHLPDCNQPRPSILEVACGSANDYRFLCASGISDHINYEGIDISEKNVANALRRHPEARFVQGSILSSGIADASFDYVFAHDLIEHLSPSAMDRAVEEMARMSRREVWIHLFRATEDCDHIIAPEPPYHWNTISTSLLSRQFSANGFDTEVLFVGKWLSGKFSIGEHYNPRAATLIASRQVVRQYHHLRPQC